MTSRRMVVLGRVQGVGFRAYVVQIAERLGVVGEVWNRRDGAVELVASHADVEVLEELAARLQHGPGRVDRVTFEPEPEHEGDWDFRIAPTM